MIHQTLVYSRHPDNKCSRNRLENNSDHWNALLLSLRELAEWAISKEAELEAMGPIGGDEMSIRRQQVSTVKT